jgi:hypothetical protein
VNSEQYVTTAFILRKDSRTERLLDDWAAVWKANLNLINDAVSSYPNFDGFIEHRHDQSAFSLLCKLAGAESLCYLDLEYPVLLPKGNFLDGTSYFLNWKILFNTPIHAKRDKDMGGLNKLYIRVRNRYAKGFKDAVEPEKKIWGLGR